MGFGQSKGPPATHKQVEALLELLHDAGHVDFRDARGPMGFNQRQAGGKFTRDEADVFIEELERAQEFGGAPSVVAAERPSKEQIALAPFTDQTLAAELQRRGWVVVEP